MVAARVSAASTHRRGLASTWPTCCGGREANAQAIESDVTDSSGGASKCEYGVWEAREVRVSQVSLANASYYGSTFLLWFESLGPRQASPPYYGSTFLVWFESLVPHSPTPPY